MDPKLEILITELGAANGRVEALEKGLKQLMSQLIDGGMNANSILIISIKTLLNK